MHEHCFATAAHAEGATVFRLRLRPYSLGHEILLWKTRNPLITYSPESFLELDPGVQRAKLFIAALICERTWRQNHSPFQWLRLTARFRRDCDTLVELERFRDYRDAGTQDFPTVRMPRLNTGAPFHYFGAPDEARLLLFIARDGLHQAFGYETPYDFPLAFARQLYSAQAEADGNLWIKNHQDAENEARLAAFEQKYPESTLAIGDEAVQKAAEAWNREHPEAPVPLMHPPKEAGDA